MASIDTITDAVTAALAEIDAQLAEVAPELEGLRDWARLNILDGTRREIDDAIGDFDRRVALLTTAKQVYQAQLATVTAANQALVDDGAPTIPERQISAAAIADLDEQQRTMTAARKLFVPQASTLGLSAGGTEPK